MKDAILRQTTVYNYSAFKTKPKWEENFQAIVAIILTHLFVSHSQAILVSKLLRQIANAWNAEIGY